MGPSRCEVFAHRGASTTHPENTLPAFVEARRLGADGVELDVRLAGDGVPVVIHDATVDRTTDGQGPVAGLAAAALARLDAGSWHGADFAGTPVPMLSEVLEWSGGTGMVVNLELKVSEPSEAVELARRVADVVAGCGARERVIVSSFAPLTITETRHVDTRIETAVLFRRPLRRPVEHARRLGARALHPYWRLVQPRLVAAAEAAEMPVRAWTVNDPRQVARLAGLGCAAVVTDRPDLALARLGRLVG